MKILPIILILGLLAISACSISTDTTNQGLTTQETAKQTELTSDIQASESLPADLGSLDDIDLNDLDF